MSVGDIKDKYRRVLQLIDFKRRFFLQVYLGPIFHKQLQFKS